MLAYAPLWRQRRIDLRPMSVFTPLIPPWEVRGDKGVSTYSVEASGESDFAALSASSHFANFFASAAIDRLSEGRA